MDGNAIVSGQIFECENGTFDIEIFEIIQDESRSHEEMFCDVEHAIMDALSEEGEQFFIVYAEATYTKSWTDCGYEYDVDIDITKLTDIKKINIELRK
ncbi:hypothetical protein FC756_25885 [Lysinibacillus mangiferihumi]|uniref:Uncharacterized protein n=1 Tax=Lysinibacillus mangiferihumi TaxID=1130819 RepID=A0A4V5TJS1_9BACI|nr:hypothetical protein [Lysinibacillus mangiferihumi]TKI53073.1 hypothetical protein FC756_25885 [Lysinibacillus mangiferihumi]